MSKGKKDGAEAVFARLRDNPEASRNDELPSAPVVPFAYALIEEAPGRYSAVLLEGVTARTMTRLEANGKPEQVGRAMARATSAFERRTIAKKWRLP